MNLSPTIHWTLKARRGVRGALATTLCALHCQQEKSHQSPLENSAPSDTPAMADSMKPENPPSSPGPTHSLDGEIERMDQLLRATFPNALSIAVQDQMLGFRRKEDYFILLVDVVEPDQRGSYVIKIGPAQKFREEIQAWNSCRPEGFRHDPVLLPLEMGHEETSGDNPRMTLRYGDAHQFLGVQFVRTFEEAAMDAVLYNAPQLSSVARVLTELFERLGHLLYTQSFPVGPLDETKGKDPDSTQHPRPLNIKHLTESLALWNQDLHKILRTRVNSIVNRGPGVFIDPVDYLRYVHGFAPLSSAPDAAPPGSTLPEGLGRAHEPLPSVPQPDPRNIIPEMIRGCAHGDLHGRNILVAAVHGRVLWPTLFDYENMSPCNLVGWDFVKLETELKIRIYPKLFPLPQISFAKRVAEFELELAQQTNNCYSSDDQWPRVSETGDPVKNLLHLLLHLRHCASQHLGEDRGRPNRWLEEYSFLLTCYGVGSAYFENLQQKELMGAFISAGAAAAQLDWPRRVPFDPESYLRDRS